MKVTGKTGQVVGAVAVEEDDELMLMTTGGQSIRIRCSEVRETGRNAQGVKLVTLRGNEKLQDIAKVVAGDDDEEESEDRGEAAPPAVDQEE
jgi:DNA gyrase subunit A